MSSAGEKRRRAIIDAAHDLFISKGYQATTIEDILAATGIAKGTLYYHFPGKDDIMNAIINTVAETITARAQGILNEDDQPLSKVMRIIASARVQQRDAALIDQFHVPNNAEFHVRSITTTVHALAPILGEAIREGVARGAFTCAYPNEMAEIVLVSAFMLTDQGFFPADPTLSAQRLQALHKTLYALLGLSDPDANTEDTP